jgi:hypothetical protein
MKKFGLILVALGALTGGAAHAALVEGTPTAGGPASPVPLFGTLIDFDDGITGSNLAANAYVAQGVTSITNTLGPSLGYHPSSQSDPNYIGTGFPNGWDADILVQFASLQAAVGIGIAGPTSLRFELLDAGMNVLEGYDLTTTPVNTYYYINRVSADVSFLRVAGDFVAIDDLQFDNQTVPPNGGIPEPSTWAMMLLGFGALGTALRSRRRATATA